MKEIGKQLRLSTFDKCLSAYYCGNSFIGEPLYNGQMSIGGNRVFSKVRSDYQYFYADVITGSLYNESGECLTSNKISVLKFEKKKEKITKKHVTVIREHNNFDLF